LFTTYKVVSGDTFESISRKVFGYESKSTRIAEFNPDIAEPLSVGTEILIPRRENLTSSRAVTNQNQVSITIGNQNVSFWESITINRTMDSIDTVELTAPFERELPGFKEVFRPFEYKPMSATIGDELIFNGVQMAVNPLIQPDRKMIECSGYSIPGVLNDCTAPISAYPLEFNNQDLQAIASRVTQSFNINVSFLNDAGSTFERVACDPGKKILPFLIDLARQRNLVLTNDENGGLIFWRSVSTGSPVAKLYQGQSPLIQVIPNFSPQNYYSHITGVDFIIVGYTGTTYTVKNDKLKTLRPFTFKTPDTTGSSVKNAVEAKAGRMFASMVLYTIELSTWRDPAGNLWKPNTTLVLQAPDAMIYNEYEFIIRNVELMRESNNEIARLELILPGSLEAKLPEVLPWDK
jgi:prophage tail gpP-like protein